jgi:hypothetical protein
LTKKAGFEFANPSANGKQGPYIAATKEVFQTQGKNFQTVTDNIIKRHG